jgi:membrane protease subunit HflK
MHDVSHVGPEPPHDEGDHHSRGHDHDHHHPPRGPGHHHSHDQRHDDRHHHRRSQRPRGASNRRWIATAIVLAAGYLATGTYVVQSNELAVVRRFGKAAVKLSEPGLHWDLPWGLAVVDRVRVDQPQQVTVGALVSADAPEPETLRGQFLTGDQNLIHLAVTIQYSVSDATQYLFAATDASRLVAVAAESLITEMCAAVPVDDILLSAQVTLGSRLEQRLQAILDGYGLGVRLLNVSFTSPAPPAEVADAFSDVLKARSDRDKRMHDARSYQARTLQQAQAQAAKLHNEAVVYQQRRLAEARGEADRFTQLLAAYKESTTPAGVLRRVFLERMEEVLPRIRKVIVNPGPNAQPIDLSILKATPEQ